MLLASITVLAINGTTTKLPIWVVAAVGASAVHTVQLAQYKACLKGGARWRNRCDYWD